MEIGLLLQVKFFMFKTSYKLILISCLQVLTVEQSPWFMLLQVKFLIFKTSFKLILISSLQVLTVEQCPWFPISLLFILSQKKNMYHRFFLKIFLILLKSEN